MLTVNVRLKEAFVPSRRVEATAPKEQIVCVLANEEDDDRAVSVRSCSLRFHNGELSGESKFDLNLETGSGLWKDFESYKAFKEAFDPSLGSSERKERVREFMLKNPKNYENVCRRQARRRRRLWLRFLSPTSPAASSGRG